MLRDVYRVMFCNDRTNFVNIVVAELQHLLHFFTF